MDNPINKKLVARALDCALSGYAQDTATRRLEVEFMNDPAHVIKQAVQYAYQGEPLPTHPQAMEPPTEAPPNKRAVRKAMIMLKVNYKNADEDAVTDCLTDLQHYCVAKGIDYLACDERAQRHFLTEITGDDNAGV